MSPNTTLFFFNIDFQLSLRLLQVTYPNIVMFSLSLPVCILEEKNPDLKNCAVFLGFFHLNKVDIQFH